MAENVCDSERVERGVTWRLFNSINRWRYLFPQIVSVTVTQEVLFVTQIDSNGSATRESFSLFVNSTLLYLISPNCRQFYYDRVGAGHSWMDRVLLLFLLNQL